MRTSDHLKPSPVYDARCGRTSNWNCAYWQYLYCANDSYHFNKFHAELLDCLTSFHDLIAFSSDASESLTFFTNVFLTSASLSWFLLRFGQTSFIAEAEPVEPSTLNQLKTTFSLFCCKAPDQVRKWLFHFRSKCTATLVFATIFSYGSDLDDMAQFFSLSQIEAYSGVAIGPDKLWEIYLGLILQWSQLHFFRDHLICN